MPYGQKKEEELETPIPGIPQTTEETGMGAYDETNDQEFDGMPHMAQGGMIPPPPTTVAPKLPGFPAQTGMADLERYLGTQRSKMGQFGPSQTMDLENQLNQRRSGAQYRTTDALKGFGDALMMGVAGAGNPGWQNQFRQGEQENAQNQRNALANARSANLQELEGGMKLDAMNPNSSASKAAQESYAPLFAKLGYAPDKIKGLSAANIENALALMSQYGGKEMEAIMQAQSLGVQGKQLGLQEKQFEESQRHNKAAEEQAAIGDKLSAAKQVLNESSALNPFRWGQRSAAKNVISELSQGGGNEGFVDVKDEAEAESLPQGTRFRLSDGRTGTVQ